MKTILKKIIPFALVLSAVFAVFSFAPFKTDALVTDADIKAMEDKIKNNEAAIKQYEQKIASLQKNLTSTTALKNELDAQIRVMQENIEDTNELITKYEELIANKNAEINARESEYSEDYGSFLEMMRVYHEDNVDNYLELILGADSFTDFLTQFERMSSLLALEQTLMQELNRETVDLQGMKEELLAQQKEAEALKDQQIKDEAALGAKLDNAITLINKYNKDEKIAQNSLAEAQKLDKELDAQLTKLLKELQAQNQQAYVGGDLLWPVDAELNYITSDYGSRTLYGKPDFHLGIDIIQLGHNIYGKNIYAANHGTVVLAVHGHRSYGNYVLIDHGGGYATLYAHCSSLLVAKGDTVIRGQTIAKIGSTGNSSGNHLHFEVRINGSTVDPLKGYVSYPSNLIVQ